MRAHCPFEFLRVGVCNVRQGDQRLIWFGSFGVTVNHCAQQRSRDGFCPSTGAECDPLCQKIIIVRLSGVFGGNLSALSSRMMPA